MPEIKDFNALADEECLKLNAKRYNGRNTINFMVGRQSFDSERLVFDTAITADFETAEAQMDSTFFNASISSTGLVRPLGAVELRPSAALNYTITAFDGFEETGTTGSNLAVDDRIGQALTGRNQIGLGFGVGGFDFEARAGVIGRLSVEGAYEAQLIQADGSSNPFDFDTVDDETFVGGYVGAQVNYNQQAGFNLIGDVEFQRGMNDQEAVSASLNAQFKF